MSPVAIRVIEFVREKRVRCAGNDKKNSYFFCKIDHSSNEIEYRQHF